MKIKNKNDYASEQFHSLLGKLKKEDLLAVIQIDNKKVTKYIFISQKRNKEIITRELVLDRVDSLFFNGWMANQYPNQKILLHYNYRNVSEIDTLFQK